MVRIDVVSTPNRISQAASTMIPRFRGSFTALPCPLSQGPDPASGEPTLVRRQSGIFCTTGLMGVRHRSGGVSEAANRILPQAVRDGLLVNENAVTCPPSGNACCDLRVNWWGNLLRPTR